jgi:hypothetical protein
MQRAAKHLTMNDSYAIVRTRIVGLIDPDQIMRQRGWLVKTHRAIRYTSSTTAR